MKTSHPCFVESVASATEDAIFNNVKKIKVVFSNFCVGGKDRLIADSDKAEVQGESPTSRLKNHVIISP